MFKRLKLLLEANRLYKLMKEINVDSDKTTTIAGMVAGISMIASGFGFDLNQDVFELAKHYLNLPNGLPLSKLISGIAFMYWGWATNKKAKKEVAVAPAK